MKSLVQILAELSVHRTFQLISYHEYTYNLADDGILIEEIRSDSVIHVEQSSRLH